jgi:UTP--glucose-1-phosphate uridylyltransferase
MASAPSTKKVRKVVIPAAGWGTRFLPATKVQPKEMLPLVDRPIIHYAVEEAVASGIGQVILVTAQNKRTIEDYFDRSLELEYFLEKRGETDLLKEVHHLADNVEICYVRQKEPLGLGHAVLQARGVVGDEPFALLLPDDLIQGPIPVLKQMLKVFRHYQGPVLAVERMNAEDIQRYGAIKPQRLAERIYQVLDVIEKPAPEEVPSDLGIVGRYILTAGIFDILENTPAGKNQEIQLTDGLRLWLREQPIYAYEYEGVRHDTGVPLGWLKATAALALKHPELGPPFREFLQGLL